MFGRKKEAPTAQEPVDQAAAAEQAANVRVGKGAPTPRRKDQVAARRRPLVPDDRKAAKAANREALREERLKTRRALDTGEERYLPLRDKGPNRRFVRDIVDARWNVGEFIMIAALVFVLFSFIQNIDVQLIVMAAFWVLILLVIADSFMLRRQIRKRLTAKFGGPNSGDVWYGVSRSLQLRRFRLPKPQVGRGQYPS
ncbi:MULTISPECIES: DUF3043 domain-containing protein [unclassified Arthrobacter]|uniref:DUF3043 domain-containing protein n=1 Tax=unclassified Arthrobacter TaxID=235627 RepID=UPI0024DFDDAC|nr:MULTISPECIES: DUF3043 domain-containing protein [unclassified Arthrobacter]MCC9145480.1 DUF3043 domain-containing protein [Arthrobacter sp. zg-Y919]MDK1276708.1 DUF3043 domain-containing protein [Arthrobacter sp. zg.Y919]MDM7989348.1 DUF3043 domain-containing protein [Arthrobacter sp. zg-Y877]WIB04347.1 DUF3043 domain-containing protein [Arthrobacter sp. zg-Y919]